MYINNNNIGAVNNFIQVRFDFALSKILCIFSDEAINSVKHCEITYGPNECDNASLISYGEPSASQIVEISLSLDVLHESAVSEQKESYCYKIKGMNGTNTITISGMFVTGIAIYNTFHNRTIYLVCYTLYISYTYRNGNSFCPFFRGK